MVMPRSRSRSMLSRTCASISRSESAPVTSSRRSASVDLPWSMCAMIEKFRINAGSMRYDDAVKPHYLTMGYKHIQFVRGDDGVAVLTLDRPAKLNALNAEMMAELESVLQEIERSPLAAGLIITGAGEKAFAAGADLSEIASAGFEA